MGYTARLVGHESNPAHAQGLRVLSFHREIISRCRYCYDSDIATV